MINHGEFYPIQCILLRQHSYFPDTNDVHMYEREGEKETQSLAFAMEQWTNRVRRNFSILNYYLRPRFEYSCDVIFSFIERYFKCDSRFFFFFFFLFNPLQIFDVYLKYSIDKHNKYNSIKECRGKCDADITSKNWNWSIIWWNVLVEWFCRKGYSKRTYRWFEISMIICYWNFICFSIRFSCCWLQNKLISNLMRWSKQWSK